MRKFRLKLTWNINVLEKSVEKLVTAFAFRGSLEKSDWQFRTIYWIPQFPVCRQWHCIRVVADSRTGLWWKKMRKSVWIFLFNSAEWEESGSMGQWIPRGFNPFHLLSSCVRLWNSLYVLISGRSLNNATWLKGPGDPAMGGNAIGGGGA